MKSCNEMQFHIGIKLKLRPDTKQQHIVAVNDGVRRFVYNRLVSLNDERHFLSRVTIYCKPVADRLSYVNDVLSSKTIFKQTVPWLASKDVDSCAFDNAYRAYFAAWKNFRKNPSAGKPVFKKKSYAQSYQTSAHYPKGASGLSDGNVRLLDSRHIQLPVLGSVKFQCSKKIRKLLVEHDADTRIGSIKVFRDNCGDYYCSLQLHSDTPFYEDMPKTGAAVGIDLNLTNLYSDSNGNVVPNPRFAAGLKSKVAKAQRKLSGKACRAKAEGRSIYKSSNYQKQRIKTAKLERRIARSREDYLNMQAKRLVENQDLIVSEDLKVKNLLKNHCLAFAVADASWSRFMQLIAIKADMYGKVYIKVPPHYTTQTCSECGHVMTGDEKIPLGVSEWVCPVCGVLHPRDINAAKNVLAKAI